MKPNYPNPRSLMSLLALGAGLALATAEELQIPDPEQGEVRESGKFVPRIDPASSTPAPDPAARLAELGITADLETIRIGDVELNRKSLAITIPATLNMTQGITEYFLGHRGGKVHESIFVTDALPADIQIACLLAGWEPQGKPTDIEIHVTWETNGPPRQYRAEELVAIAVGHSQAQDGSRIDRGPWHFIGSRINAAGFVASREGSIIALISDPDSLIANPRPGRVDDSLHAPSTDLLPSLGHPVKVVIRRLENPQPPQNP